MVSHPNLKRAAAAMSSGPWIEHQHRKRQRAPQTCEWVLGEPAFGAWRDWNDATSPSLWIHGPPGCGKSFLAQFIVDSLVERDDRSAILSYFCDGVSTPSSILQALLAQLISNPRVPTELKNEVSETIARLSPDSRAVSFDVSFKLCDTLVHAVERGPPLTIIVDGLDELPNRYLQPPDFDFPSRLVELTTLLSGYARVLVLSRTSSQIKKTLNDCPQIQITPATVQDDISKFVDIEISKHPLLNAMREKIRECLVQQSEGIFLWASLSVAALAKESSQEAVLERLENLPVSLGELYAGVFAKQTAELDPEQTMLRDAILRWLTFAVRPMSTTEVANAVAVETLAFIPDLETKSIEVCGSLVRFDHGFIKLVHHSLREYILESPPTISGMASMKSSTANLGIARTLLTYLSHPKLQALNATTHSNFRDTHPLAEYATLYWVHHVSQSASDGVFQRKIESFFTTPQAETWFDRLLPNFLHRSVLRIPPRPVISSRFFYLSILKSRLVNYFGPDSRAHVEELVSHCLQAAYEKFLRDAKQEDDAGSTTTLRRLLELGELYSWLPTQQSRVFGILEEAVLLADKLPAREVISLKVAAYQALADELKRNSEYEKAKNVLQTLLETASGALSAEDPAPMFALDSLGWVSMRCGQLKHAASYLQRALKIAASQFGSASPLTLRSKVTLAEVLGKLGQHEEAEKLCDSLQQQLAKHRESGVPLPKDSISQLNILATIYMQQEKYEQAQATYRVVVDDRRNLFGKDHRLTLWAEMQLGIAMLKGGDLAGAKEVLGGLLPRQAKVLGPQHRDVKDVRALLADIPPM